MTDQNLLKLRRRLNYDVLKQELDWFLQDAEPCEFNNVGDFISEYCDVLKDNAIEFLPDDVELTPKSKDIIYHYMVDLFGKYLFNYYKNFCF
jgi:hypothetical protein